MLKFYNTIINNLNLAKVFEKYIWRNSLLVYFAGLHAYCKLYNMSCFTATFQKFYLDFKNVVLRRSYFLMYWIKIPPPPPSPIKFWRAPRVINTCGKSCYGTWWCDPTSGVQEKRPKSSNYLKIFKTWIYLILDYSILGK